MYITHRLVASFLRSTRRPFSKDQTSHDRKEPWISMALLLTTFLSGTYYITSDHFLSLLIRKVLKDAAQASNSDNDKWNITFDKAQGCFLCGGMRFHDVHFTRTWKYVPEPPKMHQNVYSSIDIHLGTVAVHMDVISLLKKIYWDKFGEILVHRFAAADIIGKIDTIIQSPSQNDLVFMKQKFDILVGSGRVVNATLEITHKDEPSSVEMHHNLTVDSFQTLEYLSLSSLFFKTLFRSEVHGMIDDRTYHIEMEGKELPSFKTIIRLDNYPVSKILSYYQFLCNMTIHEGYSNSPLPSLADENVCIVIDAKEGIRENVEVIDIKCNMKFGNGLKKEVFFYVPMNLVSKNGGWEESMELQKISFFKIVEELKHYLTNIL